MIIEVISKKHGTHYVIVDDYIYKKLDVVNKLGLDKNKLKNQIMFVVQY